MFNQYVKRAGIGFVALCLLLLVTDRRILLTEEVRKQLLICSYFTGRSVLEVHYWHSPGVGFMRREGGTYQYRDACPFIWSPGK